MIINGRKVIGYCIVWRDGNNNVRVNALGTYFNGKNWNDTRHVFPTREAAEEATDRHQYSYNLSIVPVVGPKAKERVVVGYLVRFKDSGGDWQHYCGLGEGSDRKLLTKEQAQGVSGWGLGPYQKGYGGRVILRVMGYR